MTDFLHTPRLTLRPPREMDLSSFAHLLNNWHIAKHLGRVTYPYALDDAHRWQAFIRTFDRRSRVYTIGWNGTAIGVIGYECDEARHHAELGYWLAEGYWGRGYMTEAAQAVLTHGYTVSEHDRMVARYQHGNEASRRVLLRLGFRHTGHGRSFSTARRRSVDVALVELTQKEWLRERRDHGRAGYPSEELADQNTRLT